MAIIIGTNSWVTVAEADAYLTNVLGSQPWFALPETAGAGEASKEVYLIMAYNILVNKPGYCLSPGLTDDNVKNAQSELAFYFVGNYDSFISTADIAAKGLKDFELSKWSESFFESWRGDFPLPAIVTGFLSSYNCSNMTVNLKVD